MNFHSSTSRLCLVFIFGLILHSWTTADAAASEAITRPNLVWIVADDLGPDLSCYGTPAVRTPRIDKLAESGIRFTRAFSSSPVCSPSRSSIVTGFYQTTLKAHPHRTRNQVPLPDDVKTIMEHCRANGYFVCQNSGAPFTKRGKSDYNFLATRSDGSTRKYFDGVDWRSRKPGQPFFCQIQLHEPHRPFRQNTKPERLKTLVLPPKCVDHPITRADHANYLQTIEVLDRRVGEVLDRLQADGLADNTIVMFFGDHGRPHIWGKQWLYEGGLHVPLVIKAPKFFGSGKVDDRLVSLIDLVPTSLAMLGIDVPSKLPGDNLAADDAKRRGAIFGARDRCGDAIDTIRSVRGERWKYIRNFHPERPYLQMSGYKTLQYPEVTLLPVLSQRGILPKHVAAFLKPTRPAEELYDLQSDPGEMHNLANDPARADVLTRMRKELEAWMARSDDPGLTPEGDEEFYSELVGEKRSYFERTMQRRGLAADIAPEEYLKWWAEQLNVSKSISD